MLRVDARAKINLTLDIVGKRPDGYHDVVMIMQQLELSDVLKIREEPAGRGITLISDLPGLPRVERNLAYKAAKLFMERFDIKQGVYIELIKRIPIAAGLAGGSTDAAAVLTALNEIFKLGLTLDELCVLGSEIGSDVAFCIKGKTMLATGRGELLQPLPPLPECYVVLAKPQVDVSTAWAYQNYSAAKVKKHPDTQKVIECLAQKDVQGIGKLLCNVLESVTMEAHADVAMLKQLMIHHGIMAALMSGSGPTVFGLTQDEEQAEYVVEKLRRATAAKVILTKTVSGDEGY